MRKGQPPVFLMRESGSPKLPLKGKIRGNSHDGQKVLQYRVLDPGLISGFHISTAKRW
jgi:hypothetical protein